MLNSLKKLFEDMELSWIDSVTNIDSTDEFYSLMSIFPNLKQIFQDAQKINRNEIQRTIRHIFRSYKIFFMILSGDFSHETLSQESISKIRGKVLNQHSKNQLFIPLILMYHDIGRYIDNKKHPYQSYYLISTMDLLEPFELSDFEELLIKKIIHYHLLIATIYTGESTYYGAHSLFNDPEFTRFLSYENSINKFIDFLEIFTYIDILGYYYTKIYDHYTKYYEEISLKLKDILNCWQDKDQAMEKAKKYSLEWIEWRIAGALRIFQFVETKPHLTKEFYYKKLRESIKESNNPLLSNLNWNSLKDQYLNSTYKIQMRYSLALLMILAFGNFQRMGLKINTGVSHKLILFWTILSKEVKSRSSKHPKAVWNVFLEAMPHWSQLDNTFIERITEDKIELIIQNAKHEFDDDNDEFTLYLDLIQVTN